MGLAVLVAARYLFRSETDQNPELGTITIKYRWGCAEEIRVDANRDGRIDAVYLLDAPFGEYSREHPPVESYESSRCDGVFDIHVTYVPERRVHVDSDRDGLWDTTLRGKRAASFLQAGRVDWDACGLSKPAEGSRDAPNLDSS